MKYTFSDIRGKEVINLQNGARIGYVDDLEMINEGGLCHVTTLIIYGRNRLFGLMGREDDLYINTEDIELIGKDTILVRTEDHTEVRGQRSEVRFLGTAVYPQYEL
ncbi:MAG: YlmC/YmxH family sporulation protein [Ruminococcus sp.]|jgi:YlmC/YmxH family sporulation protein|nr:YlmC/YmxH family sporulation protein [Ruminococcus sp.]